ncbi:MAG TPA: hypothetical protein VNO14_11325 [Blastocatellia bacterium]|nr:hypothetical protein [Blastocatellia bacterium]
MRNLRSHGRKLIGAVIAAAMAALLSINSIAASGAEPQALQ